MRQTMEILSKEKSALAKLAKDCADKAKQFSGKKAASSAIECSSLISDLVGRIEEGGRHNTSSKSDNFRSNWQSLLDLSHDVKLTHDAHSGNFDRFISCFQAFKAGFD